MDALQPVVSWIEIWLLTPRIRGQGERMARDAIMPTMLALTDRGRFKELMMTRLLVRFLSHVDVSRTYPCRLGEAVKKKQFSLGIKRPRGGVSVSVGGEQLRKEICLKVNTS